MKYIVDTQVLLSSPNVLQEYDVVISSHVLREIEKLERERRNDKELQYEIRRLKRALDEHDDIYIDVKDYSFTLGNDFDPNYVDNILLQVAVDNGYGIITNDRLLKEKCKLYGIEYISLLDKESDIYLGYKYVSMTDEEMAYFYENLDKNIYGLLTNQYIIIQDENKVIKDKYRWDGNKHVKLKLPKIKDKNKKIKPKNELQECALDLLNNKNIPIKFVLGNYGSGKTYLATKMALHHVVDEGNYAKIMVVRNPIGAGEEIGFLRGSKEDKTADFFKPIIQHLDGGEQEAVKLENNGQLVKNIPFYMKGLSIDDAFIIVDEAEDLDVKLIKLIGTRLGENSVIMFSGDINQAEDKYIPNNGLARAIEMLKGEEKVGIIVLDEDVRSEASKIFTKIF